MIEALGKRLVRLYTIVTGCILTGVIILLSLTSYQSSQQKAEQIFSNQLMTIYQKLEYDSSISHDWLSEMELSNDFIISIEEKGRPLLYSGAYQPKTDRSQLITAAKEMAQKENIETSISPVSTSLLQSSLFTLYGEKGDRYKGTVLVFLSNSTYYSLVLLKDTFREQQALFWQIIFYVLAALLGIFCLYLANRRLVAHSLVPMRENEKKQQAFLAAASHELRSPMSVIWASADAAKAEPSQCDAFLATILRECHRMSRLIKDMLLLTASQNSEWKLLKAPVDMDTLLLNLYEAYAPVCNNEGIHLSLSLPDEALPIIQGDEERITQICSILLDNSVAHAADTPSIELTASMQKQKLLIKIIDHGGGISTQEKEQIFHAFFRAEESRKDKQHFGLGLSVAAELAKRHKGHLYVEDTPEGGATFCLELNRLSS